MTGKTISRTLGALVVLASIAGTTAPAQAGGSFANAVERILMSQTDGRVSKLPLQKKKQLVVCVNGVLSDMPNGMKRFVLAGNGYDDVEHRFGEVVLKNRAEWKQKIARGCAHIVV